MAHEGEVVCCGKSAGAAAYNGYGLAGGLGIGGVGHVAGVIYGVTLQAAYVYRIVYHAAAAAGLAGMLAYVSAGGGEGIVLADKLDCIRIAAVFDKSHIAGYIHAGGAESHAGHGVLHSAEAAVVQYVLLIVIPEAREPVGYKAGGVAADGAVRRVIYYPGGALDYG